MKRLITRLRLRNWRNFAEVDVALQPRTFIAGPNGSGKSNLLAALSFLRALAAPAGGLDAAVSRAEAGRGSVRSSRAGAEDLILTGIDAVIDDEPWSYDLSFRVVRGRWSGTPRVVRETVTRAGRALLDRREEDESGDAESLGQTHLEQSASNTEFRKLAAFLRSIDLMHVVVDLMRAPRDDDRARFGDRACAELLVDIEQAPDHVRSDRLKRIEMALGSIAPGLGTIAWGTSENGDPHLQIHPRGASAAAAPLTESSLSDGTLRMLAVLWYIDGEGGPLLLEEPEGSLHPAAARLLPSLLSHVAHREHAPRQLLVTTHSPDVLTDTGIEPAEVLVLTPGDLGTIVRSGDDIPQLVDAAVADLPLSHCVEALTRPRNYAQLARFGVSW